MYYAKWAAMPSTITFAANYPGAAADANVVWTGVTDEAVGEGTAHATLPGADDVHRAGYEINGWYLDAECTPGNEVVIGAGGNLTKFPIGSATYYAKWTELNVTITWNANGGAFGDGEGATDTTVWTGKTDEALPNATYTDLPEAPTFNGYTFAGWFTTAAGTGAEQTTIPEKFAWNESDVSEDGTTSNNTYWAKWTPLEAKIHFEMNGHGTQADWVGVTGQKFTDRGFTELPTPVVTGWDFGGWFFDAELNNAVDYDFETATFPAGTTTLYAKWTAGESVITFVDPKIDGDNKIVTTWTGKTGEKTNKTAWPTTATYENFKLIGWRDASTKTLHMLEGEHAEAAPGTYPAGGETYTAEWIIDGEGTLDFRTKSNGEAVLDDVPENPRLTVATTFTMPSATRDGYEFLGWYESESDADAATAAGVAGANAIAAGASQTVTLTIENPSKTYYAAWKAEAATIAFDVTYEGKTGTPIASLVDVTGGSVADKNNGSVTFPTTTLAGYYVEWYDNPARTGTPVPQLPDTFPSGTTTYYAKWIAEAAHIYLVPNNGEANIEYAGVTDGVVNNGNFRLPVVTKTGYTFDGWYATPEFTGAKLTELPHTFAIGDTYFYAKWMAAAATITFETDGGTEVAPMVGATDQAIANTSMPTTTKAGYTFVKWVDAEGNEVRALPTKFPAGTTTYTAQWDANEARIVFNVNPIGNDKLNDVTPPEPWVGKTDQPTGKTEWPEVTLPENFTFVEWQDANGNKVNVPSTFPAGTTTYNLITRYTGEVTITFETNGGTPVNSRTAMSGTPIIPRDMPETTRPGYTFAGWYEEADFSGPVVIQLERAFSIDLTYYAKWEADTSKFVFDTGEGGSLIADIEGKTGDTVPASNRAVPTPDRAGYAFDGWSVANSAGAAHGVTETDGTWMLPETFPAGITTLTAQWNASDASFEFVTNGGTSVDSINGKTGEAVADTTMPGTSKPGYAFDGWFTNPQCTGTPVTGLPATFQVGTTTYYAKWTANTATIRFAGEGVNVADMVATTGATIADTNLPKVEREGYDPIGWTVTSDTLTGDELVAIPTDKLPSTFPAGTTTYTMQWASQSASIVWAAGFEGGADITWTGQADQTLVSVNPAYTAVPQAPARDGYRFIGWYTADGTLITNATLVSKFPAGTTTYTAKWQHDGQGTMIFVTNGGSEVADITGDIDTAVNPRTMPTTTKPGYTFAGWFRDAAFTDGPVTMLPAKYGDSEFVSGIATYYAKWTADPSSITFVLNGGVETPDTTPYVKGNPGSLTGSAVTGDGTVRVNGATGDELTASTMPVATRSGYTFVGWYANADFTGERVVSLEAAMPKGNVTYYANWTANEARIVFTTNGGTAVSDMIGTTGKAIDDRTMPTTTREGYTFGGWFKNSNLTGLVTELDATYAEGTTTYYAKWTAAEAKFIFDFAYNVDGAAKVEEHIGTTDADATGITLPVGDAVARDGYTFEGWYDSTNTRVTSVPAKFPAGTTVYTAKWLAAGNGMIVFNTNGGTSVGDLEGVVGSATGLEAWPTVTKPGYDFLGWFDNAAFSGTRLDNPSNPAAGVPTTFAEGVTTYYAKFEAKTFTIVFQTNNGQPQPQAITKKVDETITDTSMPVVSREGYTFAGWYTNEALTGEVVESLPTKMPGNDVIYYAAWTPDEAKIVFNVNGGSTLQPIVGTTGAAISNADGERVAIGTTTKVGWHVDSWSAVGYNGNAITLDRDGDAWLLPAVFPAGTTTLSVTWAPNDARIEWQTNAPQGVTGTTDPEAWTGKTGEPTGKTALPSVAITGYVFQGWFDEGGNGLSMAPSTFAATESGTTVYHAEWVAVGQGKIKFVSNGGTDVPDRIGNAGATVTPATMPTVTREGYTFAGWFDNAAFTGARVTSLTGVKYIEGTKTYYAKWTANPATIMFDVDGGTAIADMVGVTDQALASTLFPDTVREGWTVEGWYANAAKTERVESLPAAFPAGTTTYYVRWTASVATIVFHGNGASEGDLTVSGYTGGNVSEQLSAMPTVTREGYDFGGWFATPDLSGVAVTTLPATFPAGTTDYYAKWNAKSVKATFNPNNGAAAFELTGVAGQVVENTNMPIVTRDGYTFAGWFDNAELTGTSVGALTSPWPSGDQEFWAKWTANPAAMVFMNGETEVTRWNGVTDQKLADAGYTTWPGAPAAEPGKVFVQWVDADGVGVGGVPEKFAAGTTTYYATWKNEGEVTITFETNGGTGVDARVGMPGAGLDTTLPTTTRAGYTFDGWFEDAELTVGPITALPGVFPNNDKTYYAGWTAREFPIEFDMNDGGTMDPGEWLDTGLTVTYDSEDGIPSLDGREAPKRTGYIFKGWNAVSVDEAGVETEIPWYTASIGVDGTTWTKQLEGAWNDMSVVTEETAPGAGDAKITLKAEWDVVIAFAVPKEIEFAIDPNNNPPTAAAKTGELQSRTPVPLTLKQLSVEQNKAGFDSMIDTSNQIDLDVKLNMTASSGGANPIILTLSQPTDEFKLTGNQLMQFVIPAYDAVADKPGVLNVGYQIQFGTNVKLHQITSTEIANVKYVASID